MLTVGDEAVQEDMLYSVVWRTKIEYGRSIKLFIIKQKSSVWNGKEMETQYIKNEYQFKKIMLSNQLSWNLTEFISYFYEYIYYRDDVCFFSNIWKNGTAGR